MTKQRTSGDALRFNGFQSPNYTIVPDELFDELLTELTGAELKALLYIIRRTFGFKKDADSISLAQMMNGITTHDGHTFDRGAGLSKPTLLQALRSLQAKNIITTERRRSAQRGDEPTVYQLKFAGEPRGKESIPPVVKKFDQGGGQKSLPGPWSKNLTTQKTVDQETEKQDVVVGALRDRGISAPVAAQLAQHPADYVLAKCEQVDWLIETKSRAVGKNAAGYLRRAIEEDYAPPPHFRSRAEREAEAAERAQEQAEEAVRLRDLEAEEARARALDLADIVRRYPPQPIPGTMHTTTAAWEATLSQLQQTLSGPNFEMFVKPTLLLRCDGAEALIGARTAFDVEQLSTRLDRYITPALSAMVGQPLHCTYVSLVAVLDDDPPAAAISPAPEPHRRATVRRPAPTGGKDLAPSPQHAL
jgi:hypothetical protein